MQNKKLQDQAKRDAVSLRLLLGKTSEVATDAEVAYFSEHPEEIDQITAPVNIHKHFLWIGMLLGMLLAAVSIGVEHSAVLTEFNPTAREFLIEITFEIGIALIGAAITAYFLGILLNSQQEAAARWRIAIRRQIGLQDED